MFIWLFLTSIFLSVPTMFLAISLMILKYYLEWTLKVSIKLLDFDKVNAELKQTHRQWWGKLNRLYFLYKILFYLCMSTYILAFAIGFTMMPEY